MSLHTGKVCNGALFQYVTDDEDGVYILLNNSKQSRLAGLGLGYFTVFIIGDIIAAVPGSIRSAHLCICNIIYTITKTKKKELK